MMIVRTPELVGNVVVQRDRFGYLDNGRCGHCSIIPIFVGPGVLLGNGDTLSNAGQHCLLEEDGSQAGSEREVVGAGHGAAGCKSS